MRRRTRRTGPAIAATALALAAAVVVHAAPEPVLVPIGSGDPVLIDGHFDAGEWRDARTIDAGDSILVQVKEYRGHVFIGIWCPFRWVAHTDVFLAVGDGSIWNLHASSQLGEQRIARDALADTLPRPRWGHTDGWYANEARFDRSRAEQLVREDPQRDRARMLFDTTYPYDGFEFQLKRTRFTGTTWRLRVELNPGFPGFERKAFPATSTRREPDGWAELRLSAPAREPARPRR